MEHERTQVDLVKRTSGLEWKFFIKDPQVESGLCLMQTNPLPGIGSRFGMK